MPNSVDVLISKTMSPEAWSNEGQWSMELKQGNRASWRVVRMRLTEGISQISRCELWLTHKERGPQAPGPEPDDFFDKVRDDTEQELQDAEDAIDAAENAYKTAPDNASKAAAAEQYAQAWADYGEELWESGGEVLDRLDYATDSWKNFEEDILGVHEGKPPWLGPIPPNPSWFLGKYRNVRITRQEPDGVVLHGRWFSGIVSEFEDLGCLPSFYRLIRVVIVPRVWLLSLRSECRIFENVSAIDVTKQLLERAGIMGDAFSPEPGIEMEVPKREYCVQYNETDLDFIRRILEEEGLVFWFRHCRGCDRFIIQKGGNELRSERLQRLGHQAAMATDLPEVDRPDVAIREDEVIWNIGIRKKLAVDIAIQRDLCFSTPQKLIEQREPPTAMPSEERPPWEYYEYPGHHELVTQDDLPTEMVPPRAHAKYRLEALRADETLGHGFSNATAMAPGQTIDVMNECDDIVPYHDSLLHHREQLVLAVEHVAVSTGMDRLGAGASPGDLPPFVTGATAGLIGSYTNRITFIPSDRPFRTSRTVPRPNIVGPQTAIVLAGQGVDPTMEGRENAHKGHWIHNDKLGRVQVRFHWDRRGDQLGPYPDGEARSCWIRVSQSWAGDEWGTTFLPRAGMEVVVHFLDGNPDRPVITGCVHSPVNPFPKERKHLDHEKENTVEKVGKRLHYDFDSTHPHTEDEIHLNILRSNSHLAGPQSTELRENGYNEMSFCDEPGRERIRIHAERNYEEKIENDETISVDNDQLTIVQADQIESINNNQELEVDGSRKKTVVGHEYMQVGTKRTLNVHGVDDHKIHGNRREEVTGQEILQIGREEGGTTVRELEVTGHRYTKIDGNDTLTVEKDRRVWCGGEHALTGSPLTMKSVDPETGKGSSMGADGNGNFLLKAEGNPGEVELIAQGSPQGDERPNGSVWAEGEAIKIKSESEDESHGVRFEAGENTWLQIGPKKIEMNAPRGVSFRCGSGKAFIGPIVKNETVEHQEFWMSLREAPVQQDEAAVNPEPPEDPAVFYLRLKGDGAAGEAVEQAESAPPDLEQIEGKFLLDSTRIETPVGAESNLTELAPEPGLLITGDNCIIKADGGLIVKSGKVNIQEKDGGEEYTNTRLLTEAEQETLGAAIQAKQDHEGAESDLEEARKDLDKASEERRKQRQKVRELDKKIKDDPGGTEVELNKAKAKEGEARRRFEQAKEDRKAAERALEVAEERGEDTTQLEQELRDAEREEAYQRNQHDLVKDDLDEAQKKHDQAVDEYNDAKADLADREQEYNEALTAMIEARSKESATEQKAEDLESQVSI